MAFIRLDLDGIKRYEQTNGRDAAHARGEKLAALAARILASQVKHTDPPTIPLMAESFTVVDTEDGVAVTNTDPAFSLIELGTHPGGGQTYVKYAPLRKATDAMESGA